MYLGAVNPLPSLAELAKRFDGPVYEFAEGIAQTVGAGSIEQAPELLRVSVVCALGIPLPDGSHSVGDLIWNWSADEVVLRKSSPASLIEEHAWHWFANDSRLAEMPQNPSRSREVKASLGLRSCPAVELTYSDCWVVGLVDETRGLTAVLPRSLTGIPLWKFSAVTPASQR